VDVAKFTLDFLKALFAWPVAAVIIALVFLRQIRGLLDGLRSLLDRVNKVNAFNVSLDLGQQLLNEAKPTPQIESTSTGISLSVSSGAYSTDYRAIILVAGIANLTDQPDQVMSWKLSFPTLGIELEPTPAPNNLIGGVPWWPSPMVKVPTNELTQGSLFLRGTGVLAEGLPQEPLKGSVTAATLHGKTLTHDVEIYRMATLQARTKAPSA